MDLLSDVFSIGSHAVFSLPRFPRNTIIPWLPVALSVRSPFAEYPFRNQMKLVSCFLCFSSGLSLSPDCIGSVEAHKLQKPDG